MRKKPNIIVTGTPGVGKSRHCEHIATATGLRHMAVNRVAEERACYDGRDAELGSWIVDEDKVGLSAACNEGEGDRLTLVCGSFLTPWRRSCRRAAT
jgi:broad-specificity NMP kinase